MRIINERNVEAALDTAMMWFRSGDINVVEQFPSRNGPMLEIIGPVTTTYRNPRERVLFSPVRDANPFLHLFESLWMLAGHNDLGFLTQFTKNMANFSDDGLTLNGAYGHRWRHHFGRDQIAELINHLTEDPMSRRAVTEMWDAREDLGSRSKDIPCNTQIVWKLRGGQLHMTVYNRSNDAIWGCYGANAVHFSFLQEYVACALGAKVGRYHQVSNSLHIYPELDVTKRMLAADPDYRNSYRYDVDTSPLLMSDDEELHNFHSDLWRFMQAPGGDWEEQTRFFRCVARPMYRAHELYREGRYLHAVAALGKVHSRDWAVAGAEWILRRKAAKERKEQKV